MASDPAPGPIGAATGAGGRAGSRDRRRGSLPATNARELLGRDPVVTLAVVGGYVSGGVSQPLGRRPMGRSLDNTLRMVELEPTAWVLCDLRMHAAVGGYAQGLAFLWSEGRTLLGTASQSLGIRRWPGELSPDR